MDSSTYVRPMMTRTRLKAKCNSPLTPSLPAPCIWCTGHFAPHCTGDDLAPKRTEVLRGKGIAPKPFVACGTQHPSLEAPSACGTPQPAPRFHADLGPVANVTWRFGAQVPIVDTSGALRRSEAMPTVGADTPYPLTATVTDLYGRTETCASSFTVLAATAAEIQARVEALECGTAAEEDTSFDEARAATCFQLLGESVAVGNSVLDVMTALTSKASLLDMNAENGHVGRVVMAGLQQMITKCEEQAAFGDIIDEDVQVAWPLALLGDDGDGGFGERRAVQRHIHVASAAPRNVNPRPKNKNMPQTKNHPKNKNHLGHKQDKSGEH